MEPCCQLGLCSQRLFEGYLFQLFECVRRVPGDNHELRDQSPIGPGVESKPRAVDKLHDTIIESPRRMAEGCVSAAMSTAAVGYQCRPIARPSTRLCAGGAPANPSLFARSSRCLTEEGCHRVPPRGVRSRISSSWAAICCRVRSGAAALMPATSRISLSSPCSRGARSSSVASTMPSDASRRTVRRSRSTVQVDSKVRFRTRTTSPQGWAGRIRRTVGSHVSNWARRRPDVPVAAGADLADGDRVAGAQAGVAANTSAAARRPQPGLGALGNQRPFELGDGAQHLQ